MKTKLQILKESTVYVLVLGILGAILYSILQLLMGNESWLPLSISGLLSFVATCILMGYLFEKEKPLWLATLQYVFIGIFSALFTILIMAIGMSFVFDFLVNQASELFRNKMGNHGIEGLLLIIPLIILSFFFVIFGLFAYLVVSYFLGNLIFSFLLQLALNRFNANSSKFD